MESQTIVGDDSRPRLTSIPVEILLQITSNLTTPEYGILRCTCKQIETTLFDSFSREFFTKRQFMFTEFSLQALMDISKSRLSSCLSHVIFGLERPSLRSLPAASHNIANPQPNIRVKNNRLLQEYVEHMSLINADQDVQMLAGAFSNLSNLETIGLRDFNSQARNRDYPNTEWKSYGVRTFELNTGSQIASPQRVATLAIGTNTAFQDQVNYLSRVFLGLLRALGKAHSRPKHFHVILRESSLHDHAFNLSKYVEPIVQNVLANLRTLFLDLNSEFPPTQVNVDNVPQGCSSYLLRKFLSGVPLLEHLRLNFRFYETEKAKDLLWWLSKPVSVVTSNITSGTSLFEPPKPIDLTKLRQLDIGMVEVDPQTLLAVIRKYRGTLCILSFHKIALLPADSVEVGEKINLWATFFDQLSKLDLKFSTLNMSFLSQELAGKAQVQPITFKNSRNPESKIWAGTDLQSGLRDFMNDLIVNRPFPDPLTIYGSDDEDNSDDSMDDIQSDSDDDEAVPDEMDL